MPLNSRVNIVFILALAGCAQPARELPPDTGPREIKAINNPEKSIQQKLRDLQQLKNSGAISPSDYDMKKKELLDKL